MSVLLTRAEDYLRLRRSLGYQLTNQGRQLVDFVGHLEARGQSRITTASALAWATQPDNAAPTWSHARISLVRGFAQYLQAFDPATEVPPADVLPDGRHRATPFIYSDEEITRIRAAAARLGSPLRAATYQTLVGLLVITGIRIGEAVGLARNDIDWGQGLLTVQHGKFASSRQLPLHPTTVDALGEYARRRDWLVPTPKASSFFLSIKGTPLNANNATHVFARLCRDADVQPHSPACRPRLHDLRH